MGIINYRKMVCWGEKMERLINIGKIKIKNSSDVKFSRLGLGFEKLDRGAFDPEKAYDKVADLGVKWIRIQSGWQRTEKEKGVYDFTWLDDIVDNLLKRGLKPWLCLAYGNGLYTEEAKKYYGAAGCPPLYTDEEKLGWSNYVTAITTHYKGRIELYEVWNEPDGIWAWKYGVNAEEYGKFALDTAKAIKAGDPNSKVVAGVTSGDDLAYMDNMFKTGIGEYMDYFSYHIYTWNEYDIFKRVNALRAVCNHYNPSIKLIQGESGAPSRSDGRGALRSGAWTPKKQAKLCARHLMVDLMTEAVFTSYFTTVDMAEALRGTIDDKSSHMDFGYFGILSADFNENGISVGEYTPKPSYTTLQTVSSVFSEEFEVCTLPINIKHEYSERIFGEEVKSNIISCGFKRENGTSAFAYWYSSDLMTTDFESTVTLQVLPFGQEIRIIDIMDGNIYKIPDEMIEKNDDALTLKNIPIKDTPLLLTFGEF